jgi:predicted nucleic acid-binding Zn ribbon protein
MTLYRRTPRRLALALEPVREQLAPESLLAEIQAAWADVVGAAMAQHTQPVAERGGVVTVTCTAAVWAQELDLLQTTVIGFLNERCASGRVSRLRCTARA